MIDRYDHEVSISTMYLSSYGGYVRFEDYQDLSDKLFDTEAELKLLKDKIADIFREM